MDQFHRWLLLSLLSHGIGFLIFIIYQSFSPTPESKVFQTAIRVDMVALPDKVVEYPLPTAANSDSSPRDSKPPTVKSESKNAKKSSPSKVDRYGVSRQLRQWQALEKLESDLKESEEALTKMRQIVFKGNKIMAGQALRGIEKLEAEDYVARVEQHVKSFWTLPQWLKSRPYRAKLLVKWDTNGIPVLIQLVETSGNEEFDQYVFETIQKATPLPSPPEKFTLLVRQQGVIFGFPD